MQQLPATFALFSFFLITCSARPNEKAVKKASGIFGVPIFGVRKHRPERQHGDTELEELAEWLTTMGYPQYATPEFIKKLDEELAYDSIEDMASIVEDEEFEDVGIPKEDAEKLQAGAKREMMGRFLAAIPVPDGAESGMYVNYTDPLIAAGYDEPDDLVNLEASEVLGLTEAEVKLFVKRAEENDTRELFSIILTMYKTTDGAANPFADVKYREGVVDALVATGSKSLADIARLKAPIPNLSDVDLAIVQAEPRIVAERSKQEL